MKITFDNILDQVVKNRSITRKEKQNAIRIFIKDNKPGNEKEADIIETLKDIKKSYSQKDASEKQPVEQRF